MSASSLLMENIPDLETRGQGTYKRFEEGSMCLHEKLYNSQTCRYPKVHPIHPKRSTMASSPHWTHLPFRLASAGEVLAAGIALPIACLVCVILRFLARARQKVRLGLDDWLLVPAAALAKYNRAYEIEAKIEFYFQLFMIAAYGFIKASIVLFYRRIFVSNKKSRFAIISNICLAVTVVWAVAFFLLFLFGCKTKVYLHWAPIQEVREHCGDPLAAESALVISDLITDLAILLLPFPKDVSNVLETVTTMLWWSMLEASLGLIAACLPTLRPVVYSARGWLQREGRKGFSGRWSRKLGSTGDQTSEGGTGSTSVDANKSSSVVIQEPRTMV
ncbi:hypothetical protein APSETT444_001930 [Aspergillus pseudonomiae]